MKHAEDALVDLALRTVPAHAEIVVLGGPAVLPPRMASRRASAVGAEEALSFLHARAHAPLGAIAAAWPTRHASLMPFLSAARGALKGDGRAIVMDLVWQTAPTPELLRAFAPAAGRDKVRPVEGYEMQIEHAGFEIAERVDVDRSQWSHGLSPEQRAAVEADTRGAARVVLWVLVPTSDDDQA